MSYQTSHSPPPLRHPIPTHPLTMPEPPSTPVSPNLNNYQRYTSSPQPPLPPSHQQQIPHSGQGQGYPNPNVPYYQPFAPGLQSTPSAQGPGQGQPQQGGPGIMSPGQGFPMPMGAFGINDATAQFGMQLGQSAVAAGQEYVQKNFGSSIPFPLLKHQFNVSNSYVLHKLRILLFPWRHRPWSRRSRRSEAGIQEWLPPREDINSPDLYIPSMALVTYVLLSAVLTGIQGRFDPQILGAASTKSIFVVIVEFLVVKLGCYLLNIQGGTVMDVAAYGGYKFVGIIPTLLATVLKFSRTLYWLVFLYSFCANAFFLLRSLRYVILPDPSSTGTVLSQAQRGRRIGFLFIIAVSQVVYMLVLVRI
ncbi:YIF1-domain-containing protein [Sistotremastrum suecicum HHB10207 ss-3]|uniref:Protein YIF1 n=1 Tax=Sistotremastrum suecicum HHB10207 ss-3 TaxID=1314776 RepID=A0A166AD85_9AGAM|nr:YIF1-domain-containing protein [Sistotremastrum suecicum HHB10207 ss-3]